MSDPPPIISSVVSEGVYTFKTDLPDIPRTTYPHRLIFTTKNVEDGNFLTTTIYDNIEYSKDFTGKVFDNQAIIDVLYDDLLELVDRRSYYLYADTENDNGETTKDDTDSNIHGITDEFTFLKVCDAKFALERVRTTNYELNLDPSTFTIAGRETGRDIDFSVVSYTRFKRLRKFKILQYRDRGNDGTSRKQKFANIMKNIGRHKLNKLL